VKREGFFKARLNARQALRWEKIRAKGQRRFMLIYGAFCWGGFMIVFLNAIHAFILHDPSERGYLVVSIVVWPLAGGLNGLLVWNRSEAAYKHFKSQKELDSLTQI
jgi:hypothetical protein